MAATATLKNKNTSLLTYFLVDRIRILSVGLYSLRESSMRLKMRLAKLQDGGGRHLEQTNTS
jgi:hypothetical protein